jgi:hypothetical protein
VFGQYWGEVVGPEFEIMVAQMCKFKEGGGLGISLEGTVEKVDGAEQNPHHYIRSGYEYSGPLKYPREMVQRRFTAPRRIHGKTVMCWYWSYLPLRRYQRDGEYK